MGDGTVYVDEKIVKDLDISEGYIEREKGFQLEEIKRRSALFRKEEGLQQAIKNKIDYNTVAILVDDGAASGVTITAAARSIRKTYPNNKLIIGLPVGPKETVELLRREADHVEVVTSPSLYFNYVGQYYQNFELVSDEKVIEIMKSRRLLL
jgi:putative phosphoribosyl transferase